MVTGKAHFHHLIASGLSWTTAIFLGQLTNGEIVLRALKFPE
jgi:hypothetical protein